MTERATAGQGLRHRRRVGVVVVRGDSMRPTLRPGDRLLVSYGSRVRPGRVVVARAPEGTVAIKRAVRREDRGWWLRGDNPARSTDSATWGAIADRDVWAVARIRLWPRPGRLGRGPDVTDRRAPDRG